MVQYKVAYKNDNIEPEVSGKYKKPYTLIRKDKNSLWLIDDGGGG
ncbi:DUF4829 domain-containing protein [Clostridium sp. P21]|uniref:DUF4829 domain-containing protein n=1 Tax=Clostridium muellerianum TaxID=2716538 RepID=A0A7Y0HLA3_9CLOT|nr:DUF4829 domain-containing protein [Clostridium muellerianum]NMM61694.1 DUF4829 domain-containing protein [Clostridium muellerianum]